MSFGIDWLSNTQNDRARYAMHVKIFEKVVSNSYPVVEHIFRGKTKKEAEGYFKAHLGVCSFFRACVETGHAGDIECRHTIEWRTL